MKGQPAVGCPGRLPGGGEASEDKQRWTRSCLWAGPVFSAFIRVSFSLPVPRRGLLKL